MAETDSLSINSTRFRTNRAPGFSGGSVSQQTGNYVPPTFKQQQGTAAGPGTAGAPKPPSESSSSPLSNVYAEPEAIKTPTLRDVAKGFAPSVGGYFGAKLGDKFGGAIGNAIGGDAGGFLSTKIPTVFGQGGIATQAPAPVYEASAPVMNEVGSELGAGGGEAFSGGAPLVSEPPGSLISEGGSELGGEAGNAAGDVSGTFGGAAGSGIGTAIGTLIATGDAGQAAKTGLGAAAGTAIGNAIVPGVGGMVGSYVGSQVAGRVICTELNARGLLDATLLRDDIDFTARISPVTIRGYHYWAVPFVRLMRRSPVLTAIVRLLAVWRAREVAYQLGRRPFGSLRGKLVRLIGEPLCYVVGIFVGTTDWTQLYSKEASS